MNITVAYRLSLLVSLLTFVYTICIHHYLFILTIAIIHFTYVYLEKKYRHILPVNNKAVIITGCDTGFGHHLANRLANHGFTVFAGVLNSDCAGSCKLRDRQMSNLHIVQLDITKETEIKAAVTQVKNSLGSENLWGVVNNAGFEIPGDIELCTMSQFKKCHDVNLYGQIAIIKSFLPHIRQSKGRIVNVGSVRGRYAWPGSSIYHISKYGIETMSDSLRLEMVKFGVGVSIVEPGWFDGATSIVSPEMCKRVQRECDEMWNGASSELKEVYGKKYVYAPYDGYVEAGNNLSVSASLPDPVLDAMEDALLNVHPKSRYIVDGGGGLYDRYAVCLVAISTNMFAKGNYQPLLEILARLYNFMPTYISDFLLNRWFTKRGRSIDEQCK